MVWCGCTCANAEGKRKMDLATPPDQKVREEMIELFGEKRKPIKRSVQKRSS
jgi:hypothetical protein